MPLIAGRFVFLDKTRVKRLTIHLECEWNRVLLTLDPQPQGTPGWLLRGCIRPTRWPRKEREETERDRGQMKCRKGWAQHTAHRPASTAELPKHTKDGKGPWLMWHFPKDSRGFQNFNLKCRICPRRKKIYRLGVNVVTNDFMHDKHNKALPSGPVLGERWVHPDPTLVLPPPSSTWLEWEQLWLLLAGWMHGPRRARVLWDFWNWKWKNDSLPSQWQWRSHWGLGAVGSHLSPTRKQLACPAQSGKKGQGESGESPQMPGPSCSWDAAANLVAHTCILRTNTFPFA